jgi:hypothetical protein
MDAKEFYKEHIEGEPLTHDSVIWALDEYALTKKLDKEKIIELVESMGFKLDYDKYDEAGYQWMRFRLTKDKLDEPDLRLIWYKEYTISANMKSLANIIFKAGQKLARLKIYNLENICED